MMHQQTQVINYKDFLNLETLHLIFYYLTAIGRLSDMQCLIKINYILVTGFWFYISNYTIFNFF